MYRLLIDQRKSMFKFNALTEHTTVYIPLAPKSNKNTLIINMSSIHKMVRFLINRDQRLLAPLSTIFQLYRAGQFYYPECNKLTNVVSSKPRMGGIRTHNVSMTNQKTYK